jgi:hypothetical protein
MTFLRTIIDINSSVHSPRIHELAILSGNNKGEGDDGALEVSGTSFKNITAIFQQKIVSGQGSKIL